MFGFGSLLALPVLVAYWVGVISLGKSGRNGAWWCMMIGTVLTTLGLFASVASMVMMYLTGFGSISGLGDYYVIVIVAASSLSGLGSLLFGIGFAIHGLKHRRVYERAEELENVIAAQSEQRAREEGNRNR